KRFPESLVCVTHADLLTYLPTIERNALVEFGQKLFPDPEKVNQNQIIVAGSGKPVLRNLRQAPIFLDGPNEKADELLNAIRRQLAHIERQTPAARLSDAPSAAEPPALDDE